MIMVKTRIQGDHKDIGGITLLRIELDGQAVDSIGIQKLQNPHCVSSRTPTASYSPIDLSSEKYTIRAIGAAHGLFKHMSASRDLPLI